jgi:hypothetical protein
MRTGRAGLLSRTGWLVVGVLSGVVGAWMCLVVAGGALAGEEADPTQVTTVPGSGPEDALPEPLPPGVSPDEVIVDHDPPYAHIAPVADDALEACSADERLAQTEGCRVFFAVEDGRLKPGDYSKAEFDAIMGSGETSGR